MIGLREIFQEAGAGRVIQFLVRTSDNSIHHVRQFLPRRIGDVAFAHQVGTSHEYPVDVILLVQILLGLDNPAKSRQSSFETVGKCLSTHGLRTNSLICSNYYFMLHNNGAAAKFLEIISTPSVIAVYAHVSV